MELQMQVAQAVQVLNHDIHSRNRVAANQWLVQFQHSDAAWEVATGILTSGSAYLRHDFEVELFAAQILKRKIQNEGVNLNADSRCALQAALLVSAKKFSAGPAQLLTQICLALSALVLRAVELKKPVEQLFASLYKIQGEGTGTNAILELLTVLPEEVIEDQAVNATVNSGRRWQLTQELMSQTGAVLEFLLRQTKEDCIENVHQQDRHRKVLRSLLSWVRVGCFLEIPQSSVAGHPLLGFVYTSLQVPSTFDLAVEVLTELVSRHEALPQVLLSKMPSFKEGLLHPAITNRNERVIGGLACLLAELGQAAPMLIAEGSPEAFVLTDALLSCVAYPSKDWEIANSTLSFWCTLVEFILGLNTDGDSQRKKAITAFVPVYAALLDALFLRAEVVDYNTDEFDRLSNLPDGLAQFRRNLEELLTDICCFLGPNQFLAKVLSGAARITMESPIHWQMVEVRLFALNTVAEVVLEDEQPSDLSIVMHMMMAMHSNHIDADPALMNLVHKSAAEVAGSCSKLLCPNATAVGPVLSFLALGLQSPVAASSCATALRKVCEEASTLLNEPGNLEGLLWIGEGLHRMHLSLREEEDIICAVGCVLAAVGSQEVLNSSLKRVLKPSYEAIQALLKEDSEGFLSKHSASYAAILESGVRALTRLGLILSQLSVSSSSSQNGEDPVLDVLCHFWPLLESVLASRHMENSSLAAAVCRSLSYIIQASGQHFSTLLPGVMIALSQDFISFQSHECFIRTAAVALEEFGDKELFGPLFINTFSAFASADVISTMNSSYACDQEPDLVEAYISFTSTFLCQCPKDVVVAAGSLIETSLRKSTIWCTAMHRGAALAAMSYMSRFLEVSILSLLDCGAQAVEISLSGLFLRICSECGENAVSGVVYALLGVSAMTRVHKAATILQQLATLCHLCERTNWKPRLGWSSLQGWLVNVVQTIPLDYLKPGEAEQLIPSWLKALEVASSDYCKSKLSHDGRTSSGGYMQGNGGRTLKRIIREFADAHRHITPNFGSM